ncbi:unnamed protein product, partial [marine sediment metagenome]
VLIDVVRLELANTGRGARGSSGLLWIHSIRPIY